MRALVPAIHAEPSLERWAAGTLALQRRAIARVAAWMAGTSPAMTICGLAQDRTRVRGFVHDHARSISPLARQAPLAGHSGDGRAGRRRAGRLDRRAGGGAG